MKIKMRTIYASERASVQPGGLIDLPSDEAKALVAGGYASSVEVERATISIPEKAVAPAQERPRGRNR